MKINRFNILIITLFSALAGGLIVISPLFFQDTIAKATVEEAMIKDTFIVAKGIVESEEEIEISSQVMGIISEVKVNEGDQVKKGQVLIELDNCKIMTRIKLAEAKLKEAKAHHRELEVGYRNEDIQMARSRVNRADIIHEKAKNEYERQKRLYHKEATTLVDVEKAEERMKVAAAELNESKANCEKLVKGVRKEKIERAESAVEKTTSELNYYQAVLKDYTILSPINGLVADRYRDGGETVNEGTLLMKLINLHKLRIRAELEESDVGKVVEGQPVQVVVDAYQDRVYQGKTYKVFPILRKYSLRVFDPSAAYDINAQDIYAKLDDFSGLKQGMQVTVRFPIKKDEIVKSLINGKHEPKSFALQKTKKSIY